MRNFISSMMLLILFFTVATSYSQEASTRRFNQNFALQSTASASMPMFHVFTNHKQMNYFFKPAIIGEANAAPMIGSKDFVNQFVVAISGSTAANKTPVISTVQAKNNNLYVYYEEVESSDDEKSAVMAISKDTFKDIVFVDRNSGKQKKIHYADVPPTIAKIVLSYLDMPASESYKNEYQISIDEMGEVIVVKDENGEITNRLDFTVPEKTFNNLKVSTVNLDNGGEKINRELVRGKKYREILLLDEFNRVVYSLTWDNKNQVNEFTQKFVQIIENIVPEKSISFRKTSETEVASN